MIKNAKITGTKIGKGEYGVTVQLFVEFDTWEKSVGGIPLDRSKGFSVIEGICEVVGAKDWEDLPGQYIRIKDEGRGCAIREIGNLTEEVWINLRDFTDEV